MKRSFTLIEVIVGLALFSLLATLLFGLYMGLIRINEVQKKEVGRIEQLITMRTLLQRSLCKAALQNKQHYFEQKVGTLLFIFDNGCDPDPAFSSLIKGALFLDAEGRFILEERPLVGDQKRLYVLTEGVKNISFESLPEEGLPFAVRIHLDEELISVVIEASPPIIGYK